MNTVKEKPAKGSRVSITTTIGKGKPTHSNAIVNSIQQQHHDYNQWQRQVLQQKTKDELIDKFIIEKDAKNRAYYFILEFGHLEAFNNYCDTH